MPINLLNLSCNKRRNKLYTCFIESLSQQGKSLGDITHFGAKLMARARLHHHFYRDLSFNTIAQHLACFALGLATDAIEQSPDILNRVLSSEEAKRIFTLFEQRIDKRIPVEYITNEAYYLGAKFYVNEHVLVPRSIMSHRFQDFIAETHWENYRVLDLCTGSGVIGISLALLNPNIHVDLIDISDKALEVARQNIKRHGLEDRVRTIQSDLFENAQGPYDLIITNPPYVSPLEYLMSPREFKNEPVIALVSGKDGLDIVHKILKQAKNYLNPKGKLIAEVGFPAAKRVKKAYPKVPFTWYKYRCPKGKEAWLGMHGTFACKADELPA